MKIFAAIIAVLTASDIIDLKKYKSKRLNALYITLTILMLIGAGVFFYVQSR